MSNPIIPLRVASDIEQQRSWEGISTPIDLAYFMARMLSLDVSALVALNEAVYSNIEPVGTDRKKIWIKTDEPISIGIPTGDSYTLIYRYSPHTPILWTQGISVIPSYMRKLTETEMTEMGLAATNSKYAWVIFQP
jgi:hypothetical protein